jgi:hypothetical protein
MDIAQLTKALQKAHITLLSNEETRFYSSAVLLGRSEVVEHVSTACTNGVDKLYGYEFMRTKTQAEVTGVALHENLHIMLKHMLRFGGLMSKDAQTANAAMDYVVNGIIYQIKGYGSWISLPQPHLYDAKFAGWSVNEVYEFLTKGRKPDGEQEGQPVRVPSPSPSPAGGQQGGDTGNTSTTSATPSINLFGQGNNANSMSSGTSVETNNGMVVTAIVSETQITNVQNKINKINKNAEL